MTANHIASIFLLVGTIAAIALLLHPLGPLGSKIWPPSPICPTPTDAQFPFFAAIAIIEAVALGIGVAWLTWCYRFVQFFFADLWQQIAVHIGIGWHLCNWALHDGFHQVVGGVDMQSLLYIEFGFHVTLILATCGIAAALITQARRYVQRF